MRLLAEKVETREVYERRGAPDTACFQGYYFCKPSFKRAPAIPAQQLAYVRLLAALNKPDLRTADVEAAGQAACGDARR